MQNIPTIKATPNQRWCDKIVTKESIENLKTTSQLIQSRDEASDFYREVVAILKNVSDLWSLETTTAEINSLRKIKNHLP